MIYPLLIFTFIEFTLITLILIAIILYKNPMKRLKYYSEFQSETGNKKSVRFTNENFIKAFNLFGKQLVEFFALKRYRKKIAKDLERAGASLNVEEAIFIAFITALVAFCLVISLTGSILFGILIGALCLAIIRIKLNYKIQKRMTKANEQLGSALDMISGSIRAGYSFLRSLEAVANEMEEPISKEFSKVIKEVNLGNSLEKALNNLLERIPSDELELLVTAVVIQRQVGGNLAEVLDNISGTLRERMTLKREVKTLTAQGKLSGWIVVLLPVALGLIISMLDSSYIKILFSDKLGLMMLALAIINEIVGIFMIRKIINIRF